MDCIVINFICNKHTFVLDRNSQVTYYACAMYIDRSEFNTSPKPTAAPIRFVQIEFKNTVFYSMKCPKSALLWVGGTLGKCSYLQIGRVKPHSIGLFL